MDPRSVSFDRAAGYYDRTRSLDPAVTAAQSDLLADQLRAAPGPCLEIGVGTGRVALPLAERGLTVVGVDLSAPMLAALREKDASRSVPAVLADATTLPFGDGSFGAVIACHVLHLVADWVAVVEEARRVLATGGVLLVSRGGAQEGLAAEVTMRVRDAVGVGGRTVGLDRLEPLDAHLAQGGARVDHLPPIDGPARTGGRGGGRTIGTYLDDLADGVYSWTWDLPPDRLRAAVDQAREWLAAEHGEPARLALPSQPIRWHRYVFAA